MNALVYSPRLDKNICYTIVDNMQVGKKIVISSPDKELKATLVETPWLIRAN